MDRSPVRIIEAEGRTLSEARKKLQEVAARELPIRYALLAEHVVQADGYGVSEGMAATKEEAVAVATNQVPQGAVILSSHIVSEGGRTTVKQEASDPDAARAHVEATLPAGARVEAVRVARPGKAGMLGIGKRDPEYSLDVVSPAVAEVEWRRTARVAGEFGDAAALRRTRAESWRAEHAGFVDCWKCGRSILAGEATVVETSELRACPAYMAYAVKEEFRKVWGANYALAPCDHEAARAEVDRQLSAAAVWPVCATCAEQRMPEDHSVQVLMDRPT